MTSIRRYNRTQRFGLGFRYGTSYAITAIRDNITNGNIRTEEYVLGDGERLDTLAGKLYGDARLFWVLASASGIGNISQIPPGTLIIVPNVEDLSKYIG